MSKRLQVLIEPKEYREFQKMAKQAHTSLGEWVRQALRRTTQQTSGRSAAEKLASIRRASAHAFPSGEIDQILSEIEQGYLA